MSKDRDNFLHGEGNAIALPSRGIEQVQNIRNACDVLRQRLGHTQRLIMVKQQHIAVNKKYIAQRQLPYLENNNLQLQALSVSLSPNDPRQQKIADTIHFNTTLIIGISKTVDGILPDVKEAEEATLILEQRLQTLQQRVAALQQELASKEAELQQLLSPVSVNLPWAFFPDVSPASDDEEDEPISGTFLTLNRRYNDLT